MIRLIFALALALIFWAQQPADDRYRIGPGDVLDVRTNDAASGQSTLFTVTPAGLLEHPLLTEPMNVGGASCSQ